MSSTTPWLLRVTDPVWRDDHDYPAGFRVQGSNLSIYIAIVDSGPNTANGAVDPVDSEDGIYWLSLKKSLSVGYPNELTPEDIGAPTSSTFDSLAYIVQDFRDSLKNGTGTMSGSVAVGESITLPNGISYVPGMYALQVFWNGLKLSAGVHYTEGEVDDEEAGTASTISLLFPVERGDEIDFFVLPHSNASTVSGSAGEEGVSSSTLVSLQRTVVALQTEVAQMQSSVTQLQSDTELNPAPAETYVDNYTN